MKVELAKTKIEAWEGKELASTPGVEGFFQNWAPSGHVEHIHVTVISSRSCLAGDAILAM